MNYLFDKWNEVVARLGNKNIFLFLDYDGTIAPIVEQPDKAIIPETIRETLNRLVQDSGVRIAVISGRSLKDIRSRVNMDDIIYSGNHGLEIAGHGFTYEYEVPGPYKEAIENIKRELLDKLSKFEGVLIEDKGLTLSIHYRLADESIVPDLHSTLGQYYGNKIVNIREDKKTFEIVPLLAWNKGNAVLSILKDTPLIFGKEVFPIYVGDTLTDEHAFVAINDIGLTIRIGNYRHSSAQYYLNDVADVNIFLDKLAMRNKAETIKE